MNLSRFIANKTAFSEPSAFVGVIIKIAIAGVAIGLAVMIITMSTITGFKNQITEKIFGFWGHLHITNNNITISNEQIPIDSDLTFADSLRQIAEVSYNSEDEDELQVSKGGIRHLQEYAVASAILNTKEDYEGIILKGVGFDFDWDNMSRYIKEGRAIQLARDSLSDDILISETTSKRMKLNVGKSIIVSYVKDKDIIKRRFKICGIYKTGLIEFDERFAMVDIREIQQFLKWAPNEIAGYEVFLDDLDDLEIMDNYIYYSDVLPRGLFAQSIKNKFSSIFEWLELQNINETVILFLMIIVCVINMITAILILILERTNMIGILKSLGSTDQSIRRIFLYHGFYIILWGMLIGNVIGIGLCLLQKKFGILKLEESDYYLSVAPIEFNFWSILIMNIVTIIIVLSALIIPTYLITKITPVKALRFK